ncbi:MAG: M23 family metallopeptidase [Defluviitaleaceae bacterium]|nr:M23 family metallopeptidase [Defluviitaleaceae bacterium]
MTGGNSTVITPGGNRSPSTPTPSTLGANNATTPRNDDCTIHTGMHHGDMPFEFCSINGLAHVCATTGRVFTISPPVQYVRPVSVPVVPVDGTFRAFGASRSGGTRNHAGIDFVPEFNIRHGLTADDFPFVYAVVDGVVISYYHFYRGTNALAIEKSNGRIVRYTEIHALAGISVGSRVEQGQPIARMARMTGINEIMLHLEYFMGTSEGSLTNRSNTSYDYVPPRNYQRRRDLLDPTPFFDLP